MYIIIWTLNNNMYCFQAGLHFAVCLQGGPQFAVCFQAGPHFAVCFQAGLHFAVCFHVECVAELLRHRTRDVWVRGFRFSPPAM